MKIKDFPKDSLPREKLIHYGASNLSNCELLSIILSTGNKNENVLELSSKILSKYNLKKLSRINFNSLMKESGIGFAKSCKILSCFELGRRLSSFKEEAKVIIYSSEDVAKIFIPEMSFLEKEVFKAVFIDSKNQVLSSENIFVGTLNQSLVHPREIFKKALEENSAGVIFLHNHPSGDLTPSKEDITSTKELIKAGKILGIDVLDHLIVGGNNYLSMKDEKILF